MFFCDMGFALLRTRVEISVTFLKSLACLSGKKKNQVSSIKFHDKDIVWRNSEDNCPKQTTDLVCKCKIMNRTWFGFFVGKEASYTYRKNVKKQLCYSSILHTWKSLSGNNWSSLCNTQIYLKNTACPYLSLWKTWNNCLGSGQNDLWRHQSHDGEKRAFVMLSARLICLHFMYHKFT